MKFQHFHVEIFKHYCALLFYLIFYSIRMYYRCINNILLLRSFVRPNCHLYMDLPVLHQTSTEYVEFERPEISMDLGRNGTSFVFILVNNLLSYIFVWNTQWRHATVQTRKLPEPISQLFDFSILLLQGPVSNSPSRKSKFSGEAKKVMSFDILLYLIKKKIHGTGVKYEGHVGD